MSRGWGGACVTERMTNYDHFARAATAGVLVQSIPERERHDDVEKDAYLDQIFYPTDLL